MGGLVSEDGYNGQVNGKIVLITGTNGVGKTYVAGSLGWKLGVSRVVGTDSVREVVREYVELDLQADLFKSTVEVEGVELYEGVRKQSEMIWKGVEAVIRRASYEGVGLVLEGVHLIPEKIDKLLVEVLPVMLVVSEEEMHRNLLVRQGEERSGKKIRNFDRIRMFQEKLRSEFVRRNWLVVENRGDGRLSEEVLERVAELL